MIELSWLVPRCRYASELAEPIVTARPTTIRSAARRLRATVAENANRRECTDEDLDVRSRSVVDKSWVRGDVALG